MNGSNTTKRRRGRPKGEPAVKRSIALREDLNKYLINKHDETKIPYNTLINIAIEQMMDNERKNK